jgi:phosphoribosyl-ATP pyrophosphohydrolase
MSDLRFLEDLERTIRERIAAPQAASYTARLAAAGCLKVAQKLGEEAIETALAAVAQDKNRVCEEAADLLYHLLLLLALREARLADVVAVLERRHRDGATARSSNRPSET